MQQMTWLFWLTLGVTVVHFVWRHVLRWLNYRYLRRRHGEIPEVLQGAFDADDMRSIEAYTLARMQFGTWKGVVSFVVLLWWVFGGGFLWLFHWVVGMGLSFVWMGIVLAWLATLFFMVIDTAWELYESFVLEARFGFNTMTLKTWIGDKLKELLLSAVLKTGLLWIVLSLVLGLPGVWWVVVWVVYVLFNLLFTYIAPYVIEPLFNKYEPLESEYGEPIRVWAEKQGVSVKAVLKVDASRRTYHSNAYLTGIGRVKRIVVFDTLLQKATLEEVMAILSHELGHWKRRHILKQWLFSVGFSFVGLFGVAWLLQFRGFSLAFGIEDALAFSSSGFFSEVVFLGVFVAGVAMFFQPVGTFLSRRREREADAYAVRSMGSAQPLQSALIKLYKENLAPFHVHPFVVKMTYSHPPLLERLTFLALEEKRLGDDTTS